MNFLNFSKKILYVFLVLNILLITFFSINSFSIEIGTFPNPDSPLARGEHPRLFFTSDDLPAIRARINNYYHAEFQDFVNKMDSVFSESPGSKSSSLLYFDTRNYAFLCVIDPQTMGVTQTHTKQEYCDNAVSHVVAISSGCQDNRHDFSSWYETGGCKMSASIGYDWTYNYATATQRQQMADKIVALYDNSDGGYGYPPYDDDKPMISNKVLPDTHGAFFGPLAVYNDPYVSTPKQQEMLNHFEEAFLNRLVAGSDVLYGPDGDSLYPELYGSGNPEGPGYGYSIFSAYMYPAAAASTALNIDFFEASPFTKYIPLFYYYKLHPFPINNKFHHSWHDTGTPGDAYFPSNCESTECIATRPRILRLYAYQLKDSDPVYAGLISWMVGESDFKVPVTNYKYAKEGTRHYGLFNMFLGGEKDIAPKTPNQANLPLFKRMGDWVMFKSSHDLYDSTYLEIDAPIWLYVAGHNKHHPTSLQMSKYGTLLLKTVNHKGGDAYDCPRVAGGAGPSEGSITGPYTDNTMSLNYPSAKTHDQSEPSQITEGSVSDVGDITIFDSKPGIFDVFGYDYSKFYKENNLVDEAIQQIVYLRGTENHEFFVEFNHIDSTYENRKIMHTPMDITSLETPWTSSDSGKWTSTSKAYSVSNTYSGSHGKLFITSVFPNTATFHKIGGSGYEWIDADGNPVYGGSLGDLCRNFAGYYTLQFRTNEKDLITVYQPGNSNTLTSAAQATALSFTGMKGVQIEDNVVMFSLSPNQEINSFNYNVVTTQPTNHILIGFLPQTAYDVNINDVISEFTTERGGVLSFQDSGTGNRIISISNPHAPSMVATPTISPSGGTFSNSIDVSLSTTTSGATIYYTTDGSTPTTSSTQYISPFTLTQTTTVKAIAVKSGMTNSNIAQVTFTKNTDECPGNVNFDEEVNIFDIIEIIKVYDKMCGQPEFNERADVKEDCVINIFDIIEVIKNWGPC